MRVRLPDRLVESNSARYNISWRTPFARPFIAPGLRLRFIPTQLNAHIVVAVCMKQSRLANRKQNIQHAHILILKRYAMMRLFFHRNRFFQRCGIDGRCFNKNSRSVRFLDFNLNGFHRRIGQILGRMRYRVSPIEFAGTPLRFLSRSVGSRHAQMAACQRNDRAPGMAVHGRRCPRQIVHAQDANLFILKFDFDGMSRCRRRILCPCWQHSQQRHQHRNLYSAHFFPRPSQHIRHRRMLQRFRCVRVLGSVATPGCARCKTYRDQTHTGPCRVNKGANATDSCALALHALPAYDFLLSAFCFPLQILCPFVSTKGTV